MNFSTYVLILLSTILMSGCIHQKPKVIDVYHGQNTVKKYCYSCHAPLVRLDGPSFKEISLKFKSNIDLVLTEEFDRRSLRDSTKIHSKIIISKKELEAIKHYILNF